MFSTVLIHSGSNRAHVLRYLVAATDCVEIVRDFDNLPTDHELKRIIGSLEPEVVIVDLGTMDALGFASQVRAVSPSTAVLGFGPSLETALTAPRVGFDMVLAADATAEEMRGAIQDSLRKQRGGVERSLFCFLPAKAGSGCSTIVMNTAAALAREERKRVLVLDADLRSGIQSILLGTEPRRSIQSVLAGITQMDKRRFPECVYSAQGVDYLLSSRSLDATPPDWADYFHLLSTVKGMYDAILVDLPELVNPATFELVRRSSQIFVVCTPEVPSMTLAKNRCQELERLSIPRTRTGLLINRWHKSDPSPEEVSRLVEHDIAKVFPNDYPGVRSAILSGRPVTPISRLGQAYGEFAAELCGKKIINDQSFTGKLKSLWGIRETIPAG